MIYTHTGAVFSPDEQYRYSLVRMWGQPHRTVTFVGLNPSTADNTVDDPTIRRCVRFAHDWGFSRLFMTNLHAYRSTDPKGLQRVGDPVGPMNFESVRRCVLQSEIVVAAWGANPVLGSAREIEYWLRQSPKVYCFGKTKHGAPRHPLYLRADSPLYSFVSSL